MNHDHHQSSSIAPPLQPTTPLSYATAIPLLVKELGLHIKNLRFVKAPQASDYFTTIDNQAPYSEDMLIASLNGLPLSPELDPAASMQRVDFAILLWHVLEQDNSQEAQAFQIVDDAEQEESVSVDEEMNPNDTNTTTSSSSTSPANEQHTASVEHVQCSVNLEQTEHSDADRFQHMMDRGIVSTQESSDIRPYEPITYAEAIAMLVHTRSLFHANRSM
ncbi:hypothetical protein SK066_13970 [Paenibacillus hunanensis]|uniref:hypothetical protein n=1 Tax=Paenibacillus hunanensis TaxID=539262 RepID=UPI002A6A52DC|nr:hypothetical protein [Paenibacillus hunanensis]WPP39730.1 hypothetical protein SK066_13970 [Paenibacillus hunanensis]